MIEVNFKPFTYESGHCSLAPTLAYFDHNCNTGALGQLKLPPRHVIIRKLGNLDLWYFLYPSGDPDKSQNLMES